jgi:hypothetical protein
MMLGRGRGEVREAACSEHNKAAGLGKSRTTASREGGQPPPLPAPSHAPSRRAARDCRPAHAPLIRPLAVLLPEVDVVWVWAYICATVPGRRTRDGGGRGEGQRRGQRTHMSKARRQGEGGVCRAGVRKLGKGPGASASAMGRRLPARCGWGVTHRPSEMKDRPSFCFVSCPPSRIDRSRSAGVVPSKRPRRLCCCQARSWHLPCTL